MAFDIFDWSETAASNNDAPPDGAPENMDPGDVNDVIRAKMADVATLLRTFPWLELTRGDTVLRLTDSLFRIVGVDRTSIFTVDRRVRVVGAGPTTVYGNVSAVVFAVSTDVTLSFDNTTDVLPGATIVPSVSVIDNNAGLAIDQDLSDEAKLIHAESANLVKDPSFEGSAPLTRIQTVAGGGTWSIGTTFRGGAKSLDLDTASQTSNATAYLNTANRADKEGHIPVREGEVYLLSMFARWSTADPLGANKVGIGMSWRDEGGTEISETVAALADPAAAYAEMNHLTVTAPATVVYGVPFIRINTGSPATTKYHFDDVAVRLVGDQPTPSVASAATVTLPDGADFVKVTGTTSITSVTASYAGRRVTLHFAGVLTFTDGSNLKLANDFVTAADSTISILCDGTDWFELARSPVPFSREFESGIQSYALNTEFAIAHGLGVKPRFWQFYGRCLTAEFGYSIGDDVIPAPSGTGPNTGWTARPDATNMNVHTSSTNFEVIRQDNGASQQVTEANWDFFVRAWV